MKLTPIKPENVSQGGERAAGGGATSATIREMVKDREGGGERAARGGGIVDVTKTGGMIVERQRRWCKEGGQRWDRLHW